MNIIIFGIRGIPGLQGGAEMRVEKTAPLLARTNYVTVLCRKGYGGGYLRWNRVNLKYLWAPKVPGLETLWHSLACTLYCLVRPTSQVHIHNIGSCLFLPLLLFFGRKPVITIHSQNYEHARWGWFARFVLRTGEWFALHGRTKVIVVAKHMKERYGGKVVHIPSGVEEEQHTGPELVLDNYILYVGRLVEEKGVLDLVRAYKGLNKPGYKLVIVGDADYETDYTRELLKEVYGNLRIILTGRLPHGHIRKYYEGCKLLVLPSYSEGFPLVMLEGLLYGAPMLLSNIPAHKEIELPIRRYYKEGQLGVKIKELVKEGQSNLEKEGFKILMKRYYSWGVVGKRVNEVYNKRREK